MRTRFTPGSAFPTIIVHIPKEIANATHTTDIQRMLDGFPSSSVNTPTFLFNFSSDSSFVFTSMVPVP